MLPVDISLKFPAVFKAVKLNSTLLQTLREAIGRVAEWLTALVFDFSGNQRSSVRSWPRSFFDFPSLESPFSRRVCLQVNERSFRLVISSTEVLYH